MLLAAVAVSVMCCACASNPQPLSGGERTVDGTFELSPSSPELSWCTVSILNWPWKHRISGFDLSVFSSSFFFYPAHSYSSLQCICFIFTSLISTSAPLWHNLSTSVSSWPLFHVLDTVSSSFLVSFPSSFPPEWISLSQVIIFYFS